MVLFWKKTIVPGRYGMENSSAVYYWIVYMVGNLCLNRLTNYLGCVLAAQPRYNQLRAVKDQQSRAVVTPSKDRSRPAKSLQSEAAANTSSSKLQDRHFTDAIGQLSSTDCSKVCPVSLSRIASSESDSCDSLWHCFASCWRLWSADFVSLQLSNAST